MEPNLATSEKNIQFKIKTGDFQNICRTCLTRNTEGKLMQDVVLENITIISLLEKFLSMQKLTSDYLPQKLCNVCVSELVKFYQFEKKCVENELILQEIYESVDIKSETLEFDNNIEHSVMEVDESDSTNNVEIKEITLQQHKKNAKCPDDRTLICAECGKIIPSGKFRQHMKTHSKEKPYLCEACPQRFSIYGNLKRHQLKHIEERQRVCNICKQVCESIAALQQHKKDLGHQDKRRNICAECGKAVASGKLNLHMRTHTKEKPFICPICTQGFSLGGNLKRHMMTHTGERPHVCQFCGKGFIQAPSLKHHMRTHLNGEKSCSSTTNFVCNYDYCGRSFKRKTRYNAHLQRHISSDESEQKDIEIEESKEYACDKCDRTYKSKNMLKVHQLTHGEKKFLCSDCGKSFFTNASLQSHLKVHTGEKPYQCTVCKKCFAHVGTFDTHMLTHTGLKPFSCNICKKKFTQQTHLRYHKRTHSGERPYGCSYCGKKFALKGNLTVHTRIHTGETPYLCPECGKGFYDSSGLKKHRRGHTQDKNDSSTGISEQRKNNQNSNMSDCENSENDIKPVEILYIDNESFIQDDNLVASNIQISNNDITEYL